MPRLAARDDGQPGFPQMIRDPALWGLATLMLATFVLWPWGG